MEIKKQTKINFKSDFDFLLRLKDTEGNEVLPSGCDWTADIFTDSLAEPFRVSCIGGRCTNCFIDDGRIHVVCNSHNLRPGMLKAEFRTWLPDNIFPDGSRTVVSPVPLGIELVRGAGDAASSADVALVPPFVRGYVTLTHEQYDALESHLPDMLYLIIEKDDSQGQ